jgi:hypothetical protein
MAHRAAPKLAERVGQHEIKIVEATEETLRGYGRIERDFPSAKIEIVRWPAQGWRPVDADTGDQGGTTEGIFSFSWKGEVLYGRNDAVTTTLIGWSRDPGEPAQRARRCCACWVARQLSSDGGQVLSAERRFLHRAAGAAGRRHRAREVHRLLLRRQLRIYFHPGVWHTPACRWRRRPSSTTAGGACMRA